MSIKRIGWVDADVFVLAINEFIVGARIEFKSKLLKSANCGSCLIFILVDDEDDDEPDDEDDFLDFLDEDECEWEWEDEFDSFFLFFDDDADSASMTFWCDWRIPINDARLFESLWLLLETDLLVSWVSSSEVSP